MSASYLVALAAIVGLWLVEKLRGGKYGDGTPVGKADDAPIPTHRHPLTATVRPPDVEARIAHEAIAAYKQRQDPVLVRAKDIKARWRLAEQEQAKRAHELFIALDEYLAKRQPLQTVYTFEKQAGGRRT